MEDLAHASCYVPAVLEVLRDRGEVPRGVPPVWWREREANAGSAQSQVANGFKWASVTAERVKYKVGRRVPTGEDRRSRRRAGRHGYLMVWRDGHACDGMMV